MQDEAALAMQEAGVWEEVEIIVDSGASSTVGGEDAVKAVEARNVRNGIAYRLAGGSNAPHMRRIVHSLYRPRV